MFQKLPQTADLDDLTPRQRDFVLAYVAAGGRKGDAGQAAFAAGYGTGDLESAKRYARDLLRNPRVLSAIRAEVSNRLSGAAPAALEALIDLCRSGPPSVRLQAAQSILDRTVGPPISRTASLHVASTLEEYLSKLEEAEARGTITIDGEIIEPTPPTGATAPPGSAAD